jgi:hypothetical protein
MVDISGGAVMPVKLTAPGGVRGPSALPQHHDQSEAVLRGRVAVAVSQADAQPVQF